MTKRDRELWAKHLEHREEQTYAPGGKIIMPGRTPNKANSYEVRIDPKLWNLIKPIVQDWKKKNPKYRAFWIGPSAEVKSYEEALAYKVTGRWHPKDDLAISIGLYGLKLDIDAVKAILDGVQLSRRVHNDRQFSLLQVERFEAETPRTEIRIQSRRQS